MATQQNLIDFEDDIIDEDEPVDPVDDAPKEPEQPDDSDKPDDSKDDGGTEDPDKGETPDEPKQTEPEESKVAFTDEQQEHLNSIVSRIKKQNRVELNATRDEIENLHKKNDELLEFIEKETARNKQLNEKLQQDGVLDDELSELAKAPEAPRRPEPEPMVQFSPNVRVFNKNLSLRQDNAELSGLREKMVSKYPDDMNGILTNLSKLVDGGRMPRDVLNIAAYDEQGPDVLKRIATDTDFANDMILAADESKDIREFVLKYQEISGNVMEKLAKPKPKPNKPLESRPGQQGSDDDSVVYVD